MRKFIKEEILESFTVGELDNPITFATITAKMEQFDEREPMFWAANKKNLIEEEKKYRLEFPFIPEETDMDDDS